MNWLGRTGMLSHFIPIKPTFFLLIVALLHCCYWKLHPFIWVVGAFPAPCLNLSILFIFFINKSPLFLPCVACFEKLLLTGFVQNILTICTKFTVNFVNICLEEDPHLKGPP